MAMLVLGLVIFLGLHSTRIFAEHGRANVIARLGEGPWRGGYSLLSLIGFALIIWGFGEARWNAAELWTSRIWARHTTILLMLFSLILIGSYIFKKSHIAVAVHHPMVWAVAIWACPAINGYDMKKPLPDAGSANAIYPAPGDSEKICSIVSVICWSACMVIGCETDDEPSAANS